MVDHFWLENKPNQYTTPTSSHCTHSCVSLTFPHIHIPIVWGLTDGPTPKPFFFPMSWLSRKDLPEWNLPTTATTATAVSMRWRYFTFLSTTSSLRWWVGSGLSNWIGLSGKGSWYGSLVSCGEASKDDGSPDIGTLSGWPLTLGGGLSGWPITSVLVPHRHNYINYSFIDNYDLYHFHRLLATGTILVQDTLSSSRQLDSVQCKHLYKFLIGK